MLWPKAELMASIPSTPNLVWTPHRQRSASYTCHKQRYMMCLIESAMQNLAWESKTSM